MHVAVSGWLLGEPSGANRRLLAILAQAAPRLTAAERITVLHRPGWAPPALGERIAWQAVPIAPMPLHRRIGDERRHLAGILHGIGANVLDHGLPLQAAADAPRIHWEPGMLHVEDAIRPDVITTLRDLGHPLNPRPTPDVYFAAIHAIQHDPATGELSGAADRRLDGNVLGY